MWRKQICLISSFNLFFTPKSPLGMNQPCHQKVHDLHDAGHYSQDIPQLPDDIRNKDPHITWTSPYPSNLDNRPDDKRFFRHIFLTCILCKIFEHIVASNVVETSWWKPNPVRSLACFSLKKKVPVKPQLTMLIEEIQRNMKDCKQPDIILLDFSKAFDKVNHEKLINMGGSRGGGDRGFSLPPPPPPIFQNKGYCNGNICWTTTGLKVGPPPPPRKFSGSAHDP